MKNIQKNPIHSDKRKIMKAEYSSIPRGVFLWTFQISEFSEKIVIISQIRIRAPLIASCSNWLIFLWIPKFSSFVVLKLLTPIRAIKRRLRKLPHQNLKFLELFDGTFFKEIWKQREFEVYFMHFRVWKFKLLSKYNCFCFFHDSLSLTPRLSGGTRESNRL